MHGWSCLEFLGVLITEEISHRQQTRIQRSVRRARLLLLKTVEEVDFSFQSSVRLPSLGSYLGPEPVSGGRIHTALSDSHTFGGTSLLGEARSLLKQSVTGFTQALDVSPNSSI